MFRSHFLIMFLHCSFFHRPIKEVYYFWTLAGGDVFSELKKNGLMKSKPPALSLPM